MGYYGDYCPPDDFDRLIADEDRRMSALDGAPVYADAAPTFTPAQEAAARGEFVRNYFRLFAQKQAAVLGADHGSKDAAAASAPSTTSAVPWMSIANALSSVATNALAANNIGPFSSTPAPQPKPQPPPSPWPKRIAIGGAIVGGVTLLVIALLRRGKRK